MQRSFSASLGSWYQHLFYEKIPWVGRCVGEILIYKQGYNYSRLEAYKASDECANVTAPKRLFYALLIDYKPTKTCLRVMEEDGAKHRGCRSREHEEERLPIQSIIPSFQMILYLALRTSHVFSSPLKCHIPSHRPHASIAPEP